MCRGRRACPDELRRGCAARPQPGLPGIMPSQTRVCSPSLQARWRALPHPPSSRLGPLCRHVLLPVKPIAMPMHGVICCQLNVCRRRVLTPPSTSHAPLPAARDDLARQRALPLRPPRPVEQAVHHDPRRRVQGDAVRSPWMSRPAAGLHAGTHEQAALQPAVLASPL